MLKKQLLIRLILSVLMVLSCGLYAVDNIVKLELTQDESVPEIKVGSASLDLKKLNVSTENIMGWQFLHSSADSGVHYLLLAIVYSSLHDGASGRFSAGEEHSLILIKLNTNYEVKKI